MKLTNVFILNIVLLVVCALPGHSQTPIAGSEVLLDKMRLNKGISGIQTTLYANINGDPFIWKNFAKGKLVVVDNKEKFDVFIRYDIYASQMHFKVKNEIYALIHPEKVVAIETDSLKFVYSKFSKSSGEDVAKDGSYFIVKADGKCKLLVKKNIRIQESEPPKLLEDAKPPKFILTKDTYYLKLNDESAVRIRNEKEFLLVLAAKKDAITSFIHKNKLKIKDIEDMVKIVSYYNKL